jgi:hypothetical protein
MATTLGLAMYAASPHRVPPICWKPTAELEFLGGVAIRKMTAAHHHHNITAAVRPRYCSASSPMTTPPVTPSDP